MVVETLGFLGDMVIFFIRRLLDLALVLYKIFYGIVKIGFIAAISYIVSMILVDFPCAVIEAIAKSKIPAKLANRIKALITVCLTLYFAYTLLLKEYPM